MFNYQGKRVKELAVMFGVSRRTIQRILKQARDISTPKIKTLGGADG
jgi:transposase